MTSRSRTARMIGLASLISGAAGCHSLRSQLSALTGSATTSASTGSTAPTGAPKPGGGFWKGPKPVLDQSVRLRHAASDLDPGRGPVSPRFDWSGHGGRLGDPLDGTGGRWPRGR